MNKKIKQIAGCLEKVAIATTGKEYRVIVGDSYKTIANNYLMVPLYSGLSTDEEIIRFLQLVGETENNPNPKDWATRIASTCFLAYKNAICELEGTYSNLTIAEVAKLIEDYKPNL